MKSRVLVVDDEQNIRKVLSALLRREGYEPLPASDGKEALRILGEEGADIDAIVTDLKMPEVDGMTLLRQVHERQSEIPVIVITAHGTVDTAVEAMKHGAFDYLQKPFEQEELRLVLAKAVRTRALARVDTRASDALSLLTRCSPSMSRIAELIRRVADTPSTVLITGESGTGKELVATALHESSSRKGRPFIKINCAAIPRELIEAELFGYEKGAFTGAVSSKPGRFELADEGTLFLDEIGEIPTEMQVKLLRALQESEFERVGGVKTLRVDVRLIAATNRDLEAAIAAGEFREDLYYRLNVVPIHLPPLRERIEDIAPLAQHFVAKYSKRLGREVEGISEEALQVLKGYPWPGNIRELENVIERTVLFTDAQVIDAGDLPEPIRRRSRPGASRPTSARLAEAFGAPGEELGEISMKEIVKQASQELERDLIARALKATGGNVTQAAKRLKISRKSLQLKMKDLGLREADEGPK
ncbi:MAG: sigma-54-dependent Fis family transcriptional regulator [Deltaproteobacteria bacterium]|nr:MAG: sigma-54-dependent Fis family transcriptional regulator [Deltaproteobacteria bacterium]